MSGSETPERDVHGTPAPGGNMPPTGEDGSPASGDGAAVQDTPAEGTPGTGTDAAGSARTAEGADPAAGSESGHAVAAAAVAGGAAGPSGPDTGEPEGPSGPDATGSEGLSGTPGAPPADPRRRTARRRRVAAAAASAVLAGALIATVSVTAVAVRDADRSAGAPLWKFPKPAEEKTAEPEAAGGLAGMLVPYGTRGYVPGPDIGEYGPDEQFSGKEAVELFKRSYAFLPRSARKAAEERLDRLGIKGHAQRSYFSRDVRGQWAQGASQVTVTLTRSDDKAMLQGMKGMVRALSDLHEVEGPRIKGYKDAACLRSDLGDEDADADEQTVESLVCLAVVGDVMAAVVENGVTPLDTDEFTRFVRSQLDRITAPGKAI